MTMTMRAIRFGVVAVGLFGSTPAALARDFVVNGGFEAGATSGVASPSQPGVYVFGVGGTTNIGGWAVTSSGNTNGSPTPLSVLVTANPPQVPAAGTYALDFDPFWDVKTGVLLGSPVVGTLPQISQVIQLPTGEYVLGFNAAVEQPDLHQSRPLLVTLSGAASLSQTAVTSRPDNTGYDFFSYDFASSGGAVTLTFTPNDFSPQPNFMLDNVSINAVPEPSTIRLLVIGGLGWFVIRTC